MICERGKRLGEDRNRRGQSFPSDSPSERAEGKEVSLPLFQLRIFSRSNGGYGENALMAFPHLFSTPYSIFFPLPASSFQSSKML